ncbi:hypothetical protein ACQR3P_29230 [Rhodococcus sp. IEGM1300]
MKLIDKKVKEMTREERKARVKMEFDRMVERNGGALTRLSKN